MCMLFASAMRLVSAPTMLLSTTDERYWGAVRMSTITLRPCLTFALRFFLRNG